MANLLILPLPSVASQSTAKLAELLESNLVPAPERLCHDGDELDPLLPAQLLSVPTLVLERHCHSMPWRCSCPSSCGSLERMCDGDIQGGVKPSCPVGEEHIGWSTVVARKESPALLQGSKASSGSRRSSYSIDLRLYEDRSKEPFRPFYNVVICLQLKNGSRKVCVHFFMCGPFPPIHLKMWKSRHRKLVVAECPDKYYLMFTGERHFPCISPLLQ